MQKKNKSCFFVYIFLIFFHVIITHTMDKDIFYSDDDMDIESSSDSDNGSSSNESSSESTSESYSSESESSHESSDNDSPNNEKIIGRVRSEKTQRLIDLLNGEEKVFPVHEIILNNLKKRKRNTQNNDSSPPKIRVKKPVDKK